MEQKRIGSVGQRQVYVEPEGAIKIYNRNGDAIPLSLEEASNLASILIKAVAHVQTENMKAMGSVPEAIKDFKKTTEEVKQVTDRFADLANGE